MISALLYVATCAGSCKLWSEFANRIHAVPWQCRTLRRIRWIHDIGMIGFPILLLWALWQCDWSFTTLWTRSYSSWLVLPACAMGFAWLAFDSARYLLRRLPEGVQHVGSRTHDVAAEVSPNPAGPGLSGQLARLPMNEVLQIEVNELRLELAGYPSDAAPLRILHLTDWHFSGTPDEPFYQYATELAIAEKYDLIVFTGDLVDDLELLSWLPSTLGRLEAPLGKLFILGNHDWFADAEVIRDAMTALGWTSVSGTVESIVHGDCRIALAGNERPWFGGVPDLVASDAAFRIALCHTPDLFGWARGQDADLVLAGHNHGGQVVLPLLGPVYSPCRHGVKHSGGIYRRGDTTMHVGRGLGGTHPLRWRCRPEMTVLEIAGRESTDEQPQVGL